MISVIYGHREANRLALSGRRVWVVRLENHDDVAVLRWNWTRTQGLIGERSRWVNGCVGEVRQQQGSSGKVITREEGWAGTVRWPGYCRAAEGWWTGLRASGGREENSSEDKRIKKRGDWDKTCFLVPITPCCSLCQKKFSHVPKQNLAP